MLFLVFLLCKNFKLCLNKCICGCWWFWLYINDVNRFGIKFICIVDILIEIGCGNISVLFCGCRIVCVFGLMKL